MNKFLFEGFEPGEGVPFIARRKLQILQKSNHGVSRVSGKMKKVGQRFRIAIVADTSFIQLHADTELTVGSDVFQQERWELQFIDRVLWDLSQQLISWNGSAVSD